MDGRGWAGFSVELGAVFKDNIALVARGTVGFSLINTAATVAGAVDLALSDMVSVSGGLGIGYLGGFGDPRPSAVIATLPIRLYLSPSPREPFAVRRRGFIFFVEVAPGVVLFGSPGLALPSSPPPAEHSPFAIGIAAGIGYAVW